MFENVSKNIRKTKFKSQKSVKQNSLISVKKFPFQMTKIKQTRTFYLLKNIQIPSTTSVIYYTCSQMGENEKQPKKSARSKSGYHVILDL